MDDIFAHFIQFSVGYNKVIIALHCHSWKIFACLPSLCQDQDSVNHYFNDTLTIEEKA